MNAEPHRFFKPTVFRVSQPPGGRTNDIFGNGHSATNGHSHTMMHDGQPAKLFPADVNSNTQHVAARASPRRCDSTQTRLFGADSDRQPASPRRVNATYAPSSIFASDDAPKSPARTPKKTIAIFERNPITGELKPPRTPQHQAHSNGYTQHNGVNGHANGHANGHVNGHHFNGHSKNEVNGINGVGGKRVPPGGYSNGII